MTTPTREEKKPTRPGPNDPEKKKRQFIAKAGGAIAYNDGEVNGKRKWKTWVHPKWGTDDEIVVYGKAPRGAIIATGPGSARKTASRLFGRIPEGLRIVDDRGVSDAVITAKDNKVTVDFVGNIIGRESRPISPRTPTVSPKIRRLK